jgi:hypothetical protein
MKLTSIVNDQRGRSINVRETLQQIGAPVLMSIGAHMRTLVYDVDYIKLKVSRRFWMVVKLNGQDLYDVEIGRVVKGEYKVVEQVLNVPVENLRSVVLQEADR